MVICVRTTLILPDALYREVKSTVAASGETMTSFVEEALRDALRRRISDAPARVDFVVVPTGSGGLQPGVELDDGAALLDAMEGR